MAVLIAAGDLNIGGAVVETSDGTKCAVFRNSDGDLAIYKDIDGTPALVDSDTPTTVFGDSGLYLNGVGAAIDSNDDIHIICVHGSSSNKTRDVAYAICDLSTGLGAWENAASFDTPPYPNARCAIAIDSNDKPRVLFVDKIAYHGTPHYQICYTDKTGASWLAAETVSDGGVLDFYGVIHLCMCPSNDVEALYRLGGGTAAYYRRRNATWGTQGTYTATSLYLFGVVCTAGDTVYRYHLEGAGQDICENDADTGYDSDGGSDIKGGPALDGTTRYVIYDDTSDDIHVIHNEGSGWVDDGTIYVGTANRVIAEWAYNHENQSGEINCIFSEGSNVYFVPYTFPVSIPCDTLTLASSSQALTVTNGPLLSIDTLALAGSIPAIAVSAPATVPMDSLTLASSAVTCQVVVQDLDVTIYPDTLTLASSTPNLTVENTLPMNTLSLVSSIPDIYIPRMMKPLSLASSLLDLVQSSGSVIMPVDSISLVGSAPTLTALQQIAMDTLSLAGSTPQIEAIVGVALGSLTLVGSPVSITDIVGGPVWTLLNTITTSGSSPDIKTAHGFLPIPPENYIVTEPNYLEEELGGLEIIIDSVTYQPEMYVRESHLYQPGATWRATVESCSKALWSNVTIKENSVTVLTGYLLKRTDERGKCHISGMDTFVKVKSIWLTGEDIETEAGQTVAYWIDFIMGHTDLEYVYPASAHGQYVEPHVSLSPLSLYDALELVIRFAGLYIWVGRQGDIVFSHIIDQSQRVIPSVYLEREKREHDEVTRHQVSAFGMGTTKFIAEGSMLGDPVERIAVIESPYMASEADAEITAENALTAWNKHDDVRTIELPGPYPEYQVADMVTEND